VQHSESIRSRDGGGCLAASPQPTAVHLRIGDLGGLLSHVIRFGQGNSTRDAPTRRALVGPGAGREPGRKPSASALRCVAQVARPTKDRRLTRTVRVSRPLRPTRSYVLEPGSGSLSSYRCPDFRSRGLRYLISGSYAPIWSKSPPGAYSALYVRSAFLPSAFPVAGVRPERGLAVGALWNE
jgi:hypothetical protein